MKYRIKSTSAIQSQKSEELPKKKMSTSASRSIRKTSQHINLSEADMLKLIHELETYQIELELQNEELMLAKEKLAVATEKYTELYDFAPSGYFTLSRKGKIIELNLNGAKMLGKERSYLKNSSFGLFVSNDTKPNFNFFLEKVFTSKTKEICELNLSIIDKLPMYVYLTGIVTGNKEHCLVIMFDITERKRIKDELLEEKEILSAIVENIPDQIYYKDRESRFILSNPASAFNCGAKTTAEIIGKTDFDFFPPDQANQYYNEEQSIMKSGRSLTNHEEISTNKITEGVRWNLTTKVPVKDSIGNVIGLVGINKDITEKKKMMEDLIKAKEHAEKSELELRHKNKELKEKNIFIQTILDHLPIGLALNNISDGQAMYMNTKFEEIYGWTSKEITSLASFFEKVYPDEEYRKQVMERIIADINSGDTEKMHWENIFVTRKDGSKRVVNAANISLLKQNTMVSTVMDITKLYQIQNDLVIAKELAEESDNLKTSFLNNISHEIRTPFNGILGFLSILQNDDLTNSERDEYISYINKSACRLFNTINNIVEISKIQAGQMKVNISETNISKLTDDLLDCFKPDAESKGLEFAINNNLPNNIDCICTDRIKLNTILNNLIGNAIKFTKSGSVELNIRLRSTNKVGEHSKDKVDGRDKADGSRDKACLVSTPFELAFSIKDTGIGIPESKHQTIFERFRQADDSNTRRFEGSGLGISIAKAYVEMLGGKIWVKSVEEKGSAFHFTIPCDGKLIEKKVIENIASDQEEAYQISPLKILIAEDDETSSIFIKVLIKPFCKEVLKASTGLEAIEACNNNPDIDLVLMDINMPEINGYEATRLIRQFNTKMVIIAQTAFALSGDKEKAIAAGCNEYISKPINKDELIALIQKYFKKQGNE